MLDGLGAWVRDYYGTDGAVDEEQLRTIALSYDYSRDAVREAFDLLNEAIKVIGPEPDSNTPEWIEWRRAMVRKLYEMRQNSPSACAPAVTPPEPVAAPAEAVPAKWWEAVLPYMVETLKAGRFRSAKEFHRALEVSSGSPGSPFEKVQGELRVRDFGQSVALKTIQNRWKEVRAAARLR